MKTYEIVKNLKLNDLLTLKSAAGDVIVRRTKKGALCTLSPMTAYESRFYIKQSDFTNAFANLSAIGLHGLIGDHAVKTRYSALPYKTKGELTP